MGLELWLSTDDLDVDRGLSEILSKFGAGALACPLVGSSVAGSL
jgi:hypothetical protein